jgi:transposase
MRFFHRISDGDGAWREPTARICVIESSTPRWLGFRREARKQGQPRGSKLDPHRDYLLGLIEATPDLTISELLERLWTERAVKASRALLWTFLDRCGLTFKKRPPMRANRTERT